MALAFGLDFLEANKLAELTVYGDYLERHPPAEEVEVVENSAWSCGHGVERWRSDCGDNSGAHPGWNQKWRTPLREAMDWLRDKAAGLFEDGLKALAPDPWRVRDDYIRVILDRSPAAIEAFLRGHFARTLSAEEKTHALKLLEIQRQAMLIFSSDGWFFDDISNIETVQVIQYAARAMQLIRDVSSMDLEPGFLGFLEKALSNRPEPENGARVYEHLVKPAVVDFPRLAAHYAVTSLFKDSSPEVRIAHYDAKPTACLKEVQGGRRMTVGKVRLKSGITWEEHTLTYAVLYLGDRNLTAGVREVDEPGGFDELCSEMRRAFAAPDGAAALRLLDREFGTNTYSLSHLFPDERRAVVREILESTLGGLEAVFRQIFEANTPVMQAMKELEVPLPEALSTPAEFVLNSNFRRLMSQDKPNFDELEKLAAEFEFWSFKPDPVPANFLAGRRIDSLMARWAERPDDLAALKSVEKAFAVLAPLAMEFDLWRSQNIYFSLGKAAGKNRTARAATGETKLQEWWDLFAEVGRRLHFNPGIFPTGRRG